MPPAYDLFWSLVTLAHIVLLVVALRLFFRDRPQGLYALAMALLMIFIPLLGPGLYLLVRRGEAALQRQRQREQSAAGLSPARH